MSLDLGEYVRTKTFRVDRTDDPASVRDGPQGDRPRYGLDRPFRKPSGGSESAGDEPPAPARPKPEWRNQYEASKAGSPAATTGASSSSPAWRIQARTAAAPTAATTPPSASPARAPNGAAIQPTTGPPNGVVPMNRIVNRAIARPRISGTASIWMNVWTPAMNVMPRLPARAPVTIATSTVGEAANRSDAPP